MLIVIFRINNITLKIIFFCPNTILRSSFHNQMYDPPLMRTHHCTQYSKKYHPKSIDKIKFFLFAFFYLYICQSTLHALSDVRRRTLKIMIALNSKLSNCSHLSSCIIYSFSYSYISLYKNHNNYYTKKFNSNVEKYCLLFFASICKWQNNFVHNNIN